MGNAHRCFHSARYIHYRIRWRSDFSKRKRVPKTGRSFFLNSCNGQKRQGQMHMYYMSLAPDQLIDATDKGNASRFINHSCDPNCEIQKWATSSTYSVGIFAIRDIIPGEEITFDYQFERIGNGAIPCFCGSPKCRHILGKPKEVPNINNVALNRVDES